MEFTVSGRSAKYLRRAGRAMQGVWIVWAIFLGLGIIFGFLASLLYATIHHNVPLFFTLLFVGGSALGFLIGWIHYGD